MAHICNSRRDQLAMAHLLEFGPLYRACCRCLPACPLLNPPSSSLALPSALPSLLPLQPNTSSRLRASCPA